jgi:hypothetical protein
MGEWMYRPTFSCSRHYLEVSGQLHAPAALPPGKEPPVPIGLETGWAPEPVWTTWRENSWPYWDSELRHLDRPARTDYAIPAPDGIITFFNDKTSAKQPEETRISDCLTFSEGILLAALHIVAWNNTQHYLATHYDAFCTLPAVSSLI